MVNIVQSAHDRLVREVADRYIRQGYSVQIEPGDADLPSFLHGFQPDMIVTTPEEKIIVEVKSGGRIRRRSYWEELKNAVGKHAGEAIDMLIERDGQQQILKPRVLGKGEKYEGKILVGQPFHVTKVTVLEAAKLSVTEPPKVVYDLVRGLGRWITGKEKAELSGPVGIVKTVGGAVKSGAGDTFKLLGALSAYLGGFNLLPWPALDGGRLLFLLFEATSRRKPDAKIEARIHAVGLLMMLTLIAVVTYSEIMPKH